MSPAPHTQHVHADAIAIASSKGHHGLAFWPPPSDHPDDPLRWPRWMKIVALVAVSLSNFTANFAGSGFSVAEQILMQQFQKNHSQVNSLLTFNFLLLGIGNLFWVPMSTKFGKRPIMLISMAMLFAILIWTAKAQTFNSLLAARCLSGFASSAGESIVPGIVSDMFFIHERATMLSIYVVLTAGASAVGPLVGAFVVSYSPGTWRDFSWVCAALAGFNLLLMFFLYPESSFKRPNSAHGAHSTQDRTIEKLDKEDDRPSFEYNEQSDVEVGGVQSFANAEVKWTKIWTSFIKYDTSIGLPVAFLRAIILVACPNVLWTIFVYGSSLAAQIILM
ncbi:putative mfs transporter [Phaeomoniella chlamydospora]|uniref:Putative mfs transporter n=1 Tax=Phaeomoniella chlamydospora TaxID=158046 RepID=A0A0G2GMI7_PHACM|nr:putative mfs transporter [Phaeomoniella chlamydospora]